MPGEHPELTRSQERLAIGALSLAMFVVAVNINLVGAMMRFIVEDPGYAALGKTAAEGRASQLLWATSGAAFVSSLLMGPVVDRIGRWLPMVVGGALFAVAMAAHAVAADHVQLLAARVVSGFGGGLVFMSGSAAVADLVPYQRRGAAMGLFSLGMFLAMPLGLPIGVAIAKSGAEAWRFSFAWLAVPGLLAIPGFWLCPKGLGKSAYKVTQIQVMRQPHVTPALLSVMLYTGAFFTAVQFAPSWLDDSGLVPKESQAFLWVVLGFTAAAGSLILPRLSDRVGKRNMVLFTSAAVAVCLLLLARVETMAGLWVVGLALTLLAAARTPSLQALMSEIVEPRMRGTLMGLRAAAVNLGAFAFAAAGSEVFRHQGYAALLYCGAGAVVVAYFLVRLFVKVNL